MRFRVFIEFEQNELNSDVLIQIAANPAHEKKILEECDVISIAGKIIKSFEIYENY